MCKEGCKCAIYKNELIVQSDTAGLVVSSQPQLGKEVLQGFVLLQLINGLGVDDLDIPVKGTALESFTKGASLLEVFCWVGLEVGLLLQGRRRRGLGHAHHKCTRFPF